jgi:hypothetical protein
MPKKSIAKPVAKPMPVPVKTPKTRLNRSYKDTLLQYMVKEFEARIDDTALNATRDALLTRVNEALRAKYPEADMAVLRKYKVADVDRCIRFTVLETGRVFSVRFTLQQADGRLADVPKFGGCYSGDIFPCDKDFEALADSWEKQLADRDELSKKKYAEYRGFIEACRYLEDVEAVVPLSEEIRKVIGANSRSLTVISPDILSRIKSDFANGVAA